MNVQKLSLTLYVTFTLLLNVGYSSKNKSNFRDLQMSDGCFCKVNILCNIIFSISVRSFRMLGGGGGGKV